MEYRTAYEAVLTEQAKKVKLKERRKTRGIKITDIKNLVSGKHAGKGDKDAKGTPVDLKSNKDKLSKTKTLAGRTKDLTIFGQLSIMYSLKQSVMILRQTSSHPFTALFVPLYHHPILTP